MIAPLYIIDLITWPIVVPFIIAFALLGPESAEEFVETTAAVVTVASYTNEAIATDGIEAEVAGLTYVYSIIPNIIGRQ